MKQKPRILVTGGSGFLGWNLLGKCTDLFEIYALRHSSPLPEHLPIHILDADMYRPDILADMIRKTPADVIIHAAALSRTSACESNPGIAHQLNVEATRAILEATDPAKTRFLYISTDLVFDGCKGFYNEQDEPKPVMVYGKTKWEAEKLVRSWGENHVILRLALMYGPPSQAYASFLGWLEKSLKKGQVNLFKDEWRTPLYVGDAACALIKLIKVEYSGILHLGGAKRCSRYEFGIEFARQADYEIKAIRGMRQEEAHLDSSRPSDVSLDSSLARDILEWSPRDFRVGIREYLREVSK